MTDASYLKQWRENNPDKLREYERRAYQKVKDKVYALLGGYVCARCGFDDPRALQIDHVNGDGHTDKHKSNRRALYAILRANGEGYQILCANCNWIKRHENGECDAIQK